MFTKTTFTDPQGTTHTDAVFMVNIANLNSNSNENYSYRFTGSGTEQPELNANSNSDASYVMYYWADQAAKDSGKYPYILANSSPVGQTFNITKEILESTAYAGLTLEQKCEKHCQEVVLV